jgi:hypothetical protein
MACIYSIYLLNSYRMLRKYVIGILVRDFNVYHPVDAEGCLGRH